MIEQLKQVCATLRTRVQIPRTHAKLHVEVCTCNLSAPGVRWEMETGDSLGPHIKVAVRTDIWDCSLVVTYMPWHAHVCTHTGHTHTHTHLAHKILTWARAHIKPSRMWGLWSGLDVCSASYHMWVSRADRPANHLKYFDETGISTCSYRQQLASIVDN